MPKVQLESLEPRSDATDVLWIDPDYIVTISYRLPLWTKSAMILCEPFLDGRRVSCAVSVPRPSTARNGIVQQSLSFSNTAKFNEVRVFMLDSQTWRPIVIDTFDCDMITVTKE